MFLWFAARSSSVSLPTRSTRKLTPSARSVFPENPLDRLARDQLCLLFAVSVSHAGSVGGAHGIALSDDVPVAQFQRAGANHHEETGDDRRVNMPDSAVRNEALLRVVPPG
jgi:hypothetical protein